MIELNSKYNDFSRFFINLRPIMTAQIFILLAGLLLILLGANYLVDGASSIAKRFGLSEFIIGVTIVGIGTSAPEMVVSFLLFKARQIWQSVTLLAPISSTQQ